MTTTFARLASALAIACATVSAPAVLAHSHQAEAHAAEAAKLAALFERSEADMLDRNPIAAPGQAVPKGPPRSQPRKRLDQAREHYPLRAAPPTLAASSTHPGASTTPPPSPPPPLSNALAATTRSDNAARARPSAATRPRPRRSLAA